MTQILTITAEIRKEFGTGAARALRRKGLVPATIYGAGQKPVSIAIAEKEITKYYKRPQYISQLIEFEVGKDKYKVLPKAIDLHPINEIVRHADFVFLDKEMQKMQVPIVWANKESCIGIKRGGYFNIVKRVLTILCPIDQLPRKIEVDIKEIEIASSIKAKDAVLPKGAKLMEDPEFVIASIIGKKGKSEELEEENTEKESTPESK